jgi:hypothetical protein
VKARRGVALLQVMVMAGALFGLCALMLKISMGRRLARGKAADGIAAAAELESARAKLWGCLSDRGYPGVSCRPAGQQAACVPPGVAAVFSGTAPDCKVSLSLER